MCQHTKDSIDNKVPQNATAGYKTVDCQNNTQNKGSLNIIFEATSRNLGIPVEKTRIQVEMDYYTISTTYVILITYLVWSPEYLPLLHMADLVATNGFDLTSLSRVHRGFMPPH